MSAEVQGEFINAVASELASAVCEAVGYWMADIDAALANRNYSTLQKLEEISWIVAEYKAAAHQDELQPRSRPPRIAGPRRSAAHHGI
jgi:hypothetical protein